jgi:hypothetical protein
MSKSPIYMFSALLIALVASMANPARAQELPVIVPTLPNYVGLGLGFTTDYLGADEFFFGGSPNQLSGGIGAVYAW